MWNGALLTMRKRMQHATDLLVNVYEKTVPWANQQVFEPNENDEPIAFAVFNTS